MRVWGFEFRARGLGFRVWGLGLPWMQWRSVEICWPVSDAGAPACLAIEGFTKQSFFLRRSPNFRLVFQIGVQVHFRVSLQLGQTGRLPPDKLPRSAGLSPTRAPPPVSV